MLHATQLRLAKGQIDAAAAADQLNQLRFRWRGDGVELETIRGLGKLYVDQGRYREALEVLRSAGNQSDRPEAIALRNDLNSAFRSLFLDGLADGMQPIQAVGLFYDFQELTPIGADGDQMVRNLVRRLVDVDLLDDAAKLLKYQVDNRLERRAQGPGRHRPGLDLSDEQAARERAAGHQRHPHHHPAARPSTPSAAWRPRAPIWAWAASTPRWILSKPTTARTRKRSAPRSPGSNAPGLRPARCTRRRWAIAGKGRGLCRPGDEARLLRSSVAYSLADDDASLGRLRQRYSGFVEGANNPDGLRVALSGMNVESLSSADFGRVTADNEAFSGWVSKMKDRFRTGGRPARRAARHGISS
jgi:hypothetical protein